MTEDCWLVLSSKDDCEKLVRRLCKKDRKTRVRLGVPLFLVDGRWAQCVDGCSELLTPDERDAIVSFMSIKNKVMIV